MLETELQGLALAVALLVLFGCASCGFHGLGVATGNGDFATEDMRGAVRAARPELQQYQDEGVEAKDGDCRDLMWFGCFFGVPGVCFGCMAALSAAFDRKGQDWLLAVVWGPVAALICCGAVIG